jgi:hypothetical protein
VSVAGGGAIATATVEACPLCGAPLHPQQEWCLRCGAAARTRLAPAPNWRLPLVALAVVIVLALGVLAAALVKLAGSESPTALVTRTVTSPAAAPPAPTAPGASSPGASTTAPLTPATPATPGTGAGGTATGGTAPGASATTGAAGASTAPASTAPAAGAAGTSTGITPSQQALQALRSKLAGK